MIYLDHCSGSIPDDNNITVVTKWMSNQVNPSTSSDAGKHASEMIDKIRMRIKGTFKTGDVIFTSGASESNALAIRSLAELGTIIASSIEHPSVHMYLQYLDKTKPGSVIWIEPDTNGKICIDAVISVHAKHPDATSILVSACGSEIPVFHDYVQIAEYCNTNNLYYHCDATQIFGKCANFIKVGMTSIAFSGHKFGAIQGSGALIVNGMPIVPIIFGKQQNGSRGGTENVASIVSLGMAYDTTMENRTLKNQQLVYLMSLFIDKLPFKTIWAPACKTLTAIADNTIVLFGSSTFPGLLLFSFHTSKTFCNIKLKNYCHDHGLVIGLGSACNTKSAKASHVIDKLTSDHNIRKGLVRLSFWDTNSENDICKSVDIVSKGIRNQCLNRQ